MQNRLLALILMFAAVSVTFADVSAANAEGYSLVESVDTSSCADFAKLPVLEIVLAPELLPGESVSTSELMGVRETIMRRLNALGVNSAIVEIEASQDIVIDLFMTDHLLSEDINRIIDVIKTTGLLEIVDTSGQYLPPGSYIRTSRDPQGLPGTNERSTEPVYTTILSDSDFQEFFPTTDSLGQLVVGFRLTNDAANTFFDFTSSHIGQPFSVTIDKQVLSSPRIDAAISSEGIISGITSSEIDDLLVILSAGPLIAPLTVVMSGTSSSLCTS
jgi:preprotein translocase subunit SecD